MRLASLIRQFPRAPVLLGAKLPSPDVGTLLAQVLQNQAAMMKDLEQIKNALPYLPAAAFDAASLATPAAAAALFSEGAIYNGQLSAILGVIGGI